MARRSQTFPDSALSGFEASSFPHEDITHRVFVIGDGPPVIVMHELPGLSPAVLHFGRRLAVAGFRVHLPLLFGEPGQDDWQASHRALCVSREFANLAAGVSAPIVHWLRALAVHVSGLHGGVRVGAIGMCLTGAFVIPLILEGVVTAPVAAQPGAPFSKRFRAVGIGRGPWMSQLNVSDDDLTQAASRVKADGRSLLAVRFEKDRICPREQLDRLESVFGDRLIRRELPGGSFLRPPHATLTEEWERAPEDPSHPTRRVFDEVVSFLNAGLR